MSATLRLAISKEELAKMPAADLTHEIRVVETAADARSALRYLSRQKIVGFDTETRPTFKKGRNYNVSLIQISTDDISFLFRINKIGLMPQLVEFLASEKVRKIGLSVKDDFHGLRKLADFEPGGFVELQDYVHRYCIVDASLQKIYAIIFSQRISKGQRLTNWEADSLTPAQQHYAALDAWACLNIYNYLEAGSFNPLESPFVAPEEPQATTTKS